jgi:hypothetical protein
LALKRQLGVSYPTSWMIHHKFMQAMQQRDDHYLLGDLTLFQWLNTILGNVKTGIGGAYHALLSRWGYLRRFM